MKKRDDHGKRNRKRELGKQVKKVEGRNRR